MLVAILGPSGTITGIEDISPKGIAEGYRPKETWVQAGPDWQVGGAVVNGIYSPPPPPDWNAIDITTLNTALAEPGSVVRALAEVMFAEVNKLRVKTGDPAYTKPQFVAALKAKMRNGA